jgi:hypothetical protein
MSRVENSRAVPNIERVAGAALEIPLSPLFLA